MFFCDILTFKVVQALPLSTSPCTQSVSSSTPTSNRIVASVISLVARVVAHVYLANINGCKITSATSQIFHSSHNQGFGGPLLLGLLPSLSLFSDNACIRSSLNVSFTRALSSPIIWLPSLFYISHVHAQKYTSLRWRFPSTCLHYLRYDCPPWGHMHRCTFTTLDRIAASRGWLRNRFDYCCHTPPQTNDDNWPRLAYGAQLIEILMNPRSERLHGKDTPNSKRVFWLF